MSLWVHGTFWFSKCLSFFIQRFLYIFGWCGPWCGMRLPCRALGCQVILLQCLFCTKWPKNWAHVLLALTFTFALTVTTTHCGWFMEFLSKIYLRQISFLVTNEWKIRKNKDTDFISTFKIYIRKWVSSTLFAVHFHQLVQF